MPRTYRPKNLSRPRRSLALALASSLLLALTAAGARASRAVAPPAPPAAPAAPPSGARPAATPAPETLYRRAHLVSAHPGVGHVEDPLLVAPWGIAALPTSPFWVADSGSNSSTLYRGDVGGSPFVRNPALPSIAVSGGPPTGVVANTTNDFAVSAGGASAPARFLFATLTGNIAGWNPTVPVGSATAFVIAGRPGRSYTGLALGNNGTGNFLYAADFAGGRIDVYDGSFALQTSGFPFVDPGIPSGFHPHNVQSLGGRLYVTYARNGFSLSFADGFVSEFDFNGNFLGRRISHPRLIIPWGLALAPAGFGQFAGALLVGNVGDGGGINAFDPATGEFLGQLREEGGLPFRAEGLRGLSFGNGAAGGDPNTLYYVASPGPSRRGLLGSLKAPSAPPPSFVQFSAQQYHVTEGGGGVTVTVTRTGDLSQPATVNFASYDGLASQTSDYQIAVGTLRFAPNESSKTFRVLVVEDNDIRGGGSVDLNLVLSNPAGAGLGFPSEADVLIQDNDFDTPKPGNPIDDIRFFVRQHYLDFLLREPEVSGFDAWVNVFIGCPVGNPACDRVTISSSFFRSREFQAKGFLVIRFYRAALGRDPSYGEFMGDLNRLTGATAQEADALRAAFPADFLARPEQRDRLEALTNAQFVDRLIAGAGVAYPNRDQLVAELDSGQKSRAAVLREVVEAPQFANHLPTFNRAFVMSQYFGYLRRDPEITGFNAWLNYLNANPNDFRTMVNGFVNSREYRNRFVE